MAEDYNKIIGYSPLEDVDREKLRHLVEVNRTIIDTFFSGKQDSKILVAGAGRGDEAELVYGSYELETFGVDLNIIKLTNSNEKKGLFFCKQNLENLAFASGEFSLIYCYHVLEHVSNHIAVLHDFHRVLLPGGVLFIGFPNKHRLISYIGTSQKVDLLEKIKWNINDYFFRIKGKFENRYGAHAGFSESEFLFDAGKIFKDIKPVRNDYMLIKYSKVSWLIKIIIALGLDEIIFPSNYYICLR